MELVLATFTALFTAVNPFGAMPVFTPALSYSGLSLILVFIALVAAVAFVLLVFSHQLVSCMGKAGLPALSRIMGFIVLSIGVNFMTTGILSLLGK